MNAVYVPDLDSAERIWHIERRSIDIGGVPHVIRLVRFGPRWLASVDTEAGPTLGADASPYLATHRALEPLGIGLADAMTLVGPMARGSGAELHIDRQSPVDGEDLPANPGTNATQQ